jgi:hypothetical protein
MEDILANKLNINKICNIILIVVLALAAPASSLRYTADEVGADEELSSRTIENVVGESMGISGSPTSAFADIKPGGGGHVIERQFYQFGEPVKINKRIYPNKKEGYLLGDSIIIFVEILPMVKEIKGLWVHESVDDKLSVPYVSNLFRMTEAKEIKSCELNAINNISHMCINIDSQDNLSFVSSDISENLMTSGGIRLDNHQRLIYWYSIIPNESGIYSTKTLLRFYDNEQPYPDMDYSLNVIVDEPMPRFDVGVTAIKKNIASRGSTLNDEPLNITYDITYLGGAGKNTNAQFEFAKLKEYSYYNITDSGKSEIDNNVRISKNLTINQTINIYKNILFNSSGIYSLPSIIITGKNYKKVYRFRQDYITVEDWMQRNKDYLFFVLGVAGIMLGGIFGKCLVKYLVKLFGRQKNDQEQLPGRNGKSR